MSSDYLKLTFLDKPLTPNQEQQNYKNRVTPFANSQIYFAPIENAQKLTDGEDVKIVYKLSLSLKNVNYEFVPGDTIGILPENCQETVEKLFVRLNIEPVADKPCKLEIASETTKRNPVLPKHVPVESTLRNIFMKHVDIQTPPKKLFLKSLSRFIKDPQELYKIQQMCTPKGSQEYTELITGPGATLLGLLDTFPSCQPPVESLLEHLPPLTPRFYSNMVTVEKGQPSKFRFPPDFHPLILVATGTGIAPFRGFLQHRGLIGGNCGEIWLFYGCRYSTRDYLYKNEIDGYLANGVLTRVDLAFSREGTEKNYVQYNIEKFGDEFVEWLLKKDAQVFVCGDAKTMVKGVRGSVINNLVKYGGMSEFDADYFVKEMESREKFVVDTWL